jgi:hypothetical protein
MELRITTLLARNQAGAQGSDFGMWIGLEPAI